VLAAWFLPVLAAGGAANAADWPTYLHDAARTGATSEPLKLPLRTAWVHTPAVGPRPAWPDPARHDYWHRKHNLSPRVTYDRAFHVVAAGGAVFFGSSGDDAVHCLDAATGRVRWSFYTEGPVRLAPTLAGGRLYAASDDGRVYCLAAADGRLLWTLRAAPDARRVIGNGRMISAAPVRTGVIVEDNIGYCFAGLFPDGAGVQLCAFDAATGKLLWRKPASISAQGYMAASAGRLFVPSGRTAPEVFDRRSGKALGGVPSAGGGYAVVAGSAVVAGPGDTGGTLDVSDAGTRRRIVSFNGLHLVARGGVYYVHSKTKLEALRGEEYLALVKARAAMLARRKKLRRPTPQRAKLDRQIAESAAAMKKCRLWTVPCAHPFSLILAGDLLLAAGDGEVAAYRTADGAKVFSAPVRGRAYGLAVAGGRLMVSTSRGDIHCFEHGSAPAGGEAAPPKRNREPDPFSLPSPYPADEWTGRYERAAEAVIRNSKADRGFCLVLDAGEGRLAYEIAKRSRMRVIGVEADAAKLAAGRKLLSRVGAYGGRVVLHRGAGGKLPYPKYFANLVVSDAAVRAGRLPTNAADIFRVLRPSGGVICIGRPGRAGPADAARVKRWLAAAKFPAAEAKVVEAGGVWAVVRRGSLAGAGEWTHGLADAGNTACSGDRRVAGPLELQWFGRPGPRQMIDRHHRNVPPLYKDGRLFVPGDEVAFCLDAYNGTELWRVSVPGSRRLGVFLDCTNMVVDDENLYVAAGDACSVFDAATGGAVRKIVLPRLPGKQDRLWGYLARADDLIVGSARKPKATYTEVSRTAEKALWGDSMSLVTSDYLFAVDRTGRKRWHYASGLAINTTITIGGGRVYLLESHSPKALANKLGRMPMGTFLPGPNYLVALDLKTGRPVWKRPVDLGDCRLIAYLSCARGRLLLSGNRYVNKKLWYFFRGIDAATGKLLWKRSHDSGYKPGGGHGEQNRHPTIVGDVVYAWPRAYRLDTGEPVAGWKFDRAGHGCGGVSASARMLFWRGNNPQMRDTRSGKAVRINRVTRPGCWINIIPAGGMVLIPEASSGCTCAYPMQTSIGYTPVEGE